MEEVSIIGLDLAKNVFQAHGAGADGSGIFRRKLSWAQVLQFMGAQLRCVVAMEACASAHHWGRAIGDLGHEVRLIPPACVKPFVKRQENDMADAEAIAEAASRPTMRFVAVRSEEQQAAAMAYRTRDLLVRQRTQTINALRAHLAEQGTVAPVGPAHFERLAALVGGDETALPAAVRDLTRLLLTQITAAAITTFEPPMETFSKGRDFAAWVGLTPKQHSSGGKERLRRTSKMVQRHSKVADRRRRCSGPMGCT